MQEHRITDVKVSVDGVEIDMARQVHLLLSAGYLLNRITPPPHPAPLPIPAGERITAAHVRALWDRPWIQPDTPPEILGCVAGWISEE